MNVMIIVGINELVQKSVNPNVPITPQEIAEDVRACVEAGASIIHLHARHHPDEANQTAPYMEIWDALEAAGVDVPVYMGTGSGYTQFAAARAAGQSTESDPVGYQPVIATASRPGNKLEIAPVIAGSVDWYNFDPRGRYWEPRPIHRTVEDAEYELEVAREYDLWVSHDIWEPGNVRIVNELWRRGLYIRPVLIKFFMSEYSTYGLPPEARYLDVFRGIIGDDVDAEWLALPYGSTDRAARDLWSHAITHGGHVRVGIGDNPGRGDDHFPSTNAGRVAQIADLIHDLGREVATVAEVRARFAPLK